MQFCTFLDFTTESRCLKAWVNAPSGFCNVNSLLTFNVLTAKIYPVFVYLQNTSQSIFITHFNA